MEAKLREFVSHWINQFKQNSTVKLTDVSGSTLFLETKRYGQINLIVPSIAIPHSVSSELEKSESSDVFLVTSTTATESCDPQTLLILNEKLERIRPSSPDALSSALQKLFPEVKQKTLITESKTEIVVISDDDKEEEGEDCSDYEYMEEDSASDADEDDGYAENYGYDMAFLDYAGTESHQIRSKQGYLYAVAMEAKQLCEAAHTLQAKFIHDSKSAYEMDHIHHTLLPWCLIEPSIQTYCLNVIMFFGGFVGSDSALASLGIPADLPIRVSLKFDKKYWYEQKKHSPCLHECHVSVVELNNVGIQQLESEVVEFYRYPSDSYVHPMIKENVAKKDVGSEEKQVEEEEEEEDDDDDDDDIMSKLRINKQNLYGIEVLLPELVKAYFDFMAKSRKPKEDLISEELQSIKSTMENPILGLICFLGKRLSTLTSWCVVCWNNLPHKVSRLRTCNQDLCLFKFEELGLGASVLHELKQAPVLVDFELSLATAAARETRRDVFEPFPGFLLKTCELRGRSGWFSNNNQSVKRQQTDNKKLDVLKDVLSSYPPMEEMQICSSEAALKRVLSKAWRGLSENKSSCLPYDVLRFLLSTNRLTMYPLDEDKKFDFPGSTYQFAILHDNPEKEAYFEQRRAKNGGSFFAFHGSGAANWFSILRNGLRSMSGTQYMSTGAAYGNGIYIASQIRTSLMYTSSSKGWNRGNLHSAFSIVAICEVINGSLSTTVSSDIMVVRPECEQDIAIRYVIVFNTYNRNQTAVAEGTKLKHTMKNTIDLTAHHKMMQEGYQKQQEDKQRVSMEARWYLASLIWKSVKQDDEGIKLNPCSSNKEMTIETKKPNAKKGNSCAALLSGNMQAIQKELKTIMKQINDAKRHGNSTDKTILAGINVELPDESNLCKWHVYLHQNLFSGSKLYKDLKDRAKGKQEISVKLECVFPNTYPMSPPFIRIVSPRFSFHTGHITVGGSICMELLTESGWSPAVCFESVLVQIVHAMIEGGGRLDKNNNSEYSEIEAKEAYVRVARQHGWMK